MATVSGLFWRAAAAFVAMPFVVAYVLPWLMRPQDTPFHGLGLPVLVVGTVVLLACVRSFYVAGRGTLAPWSPPRHLVTVGLYRWSRNPMYVGVLLVLVGWALAYPSRTLWTYALILAIAFHLRVVFFEEPWLAQTHGDEFVRYHQTVLRWVGRRG